MTDRLRVRRVTYQHAIEYEVVSSPNLFDPQNPALLSVGKIENARRFVVVDSNVDRIFSAEMRNYFLQNRIEARIVTLPGGEEFKTMESYPFHRAGIGFFSHSPEKRANHRHWGRCPDGCGWFCRRKLSPRRAAHQRTNNLDGIH